MAARLLQNGHGEEEYALRRKMGNKRAYEYKQQPKDRKAAKNKTSRKILDMSDYLEDYAEYTGQIKGLS